MNWSLYTADHSTHLKIVVVGLSIALIMTSVMGIAATEFNRGANIMMTAQTPNLIKTGAPMVFTDRDGSVVR